MPAETEPHTCTWMAWPTGGYAGGAEETWAAVAHAVARFEPVRMVVDPSAAVVAHRAHTIYDLAVLQQVARSVISTVDSVQLIQDDWDMLTAHFGDGKLLLRSLRVAGSRPRRYVLTVIADSTLNVAFLGVALRVAATKLLGELESGPAMPGSHVTSNSGATR